MFHDSKIFQDWSAVFHDFPGRAGTLLFDRLKQQQAVSHLLTV